jgi:O-antigen/teichoic acid export membrane protein
MDQRNTISSMFFLFFAVFVLISSLGLGIGQLLNPRPGFLSFWASLFLIIFCLILFGINCFNKDEEVRLANLWLNLNWCKNIIIVFALIFYCLALSKIGYLAATFALMAILFSLSGMKTWAVIISSLLSVILSYGLFHYLLKTPLPKGILTF